MAAKVLRFRVSRHRETGMYSVAFITEALGDFNLRTDMCEGQFEEETGIHLPFGRSKVFTMTPRKRAVTKKPVRQARARW